MHRLTTAGATLALALAGAPILPAQQAVHERSPRNASYTLTASLEPDSHTLRGSGRLVWRNITHTPARELRLHLYWNAWRNSASTWMHEALLRGEGAGVQDRPADDWGWIDLTALACGGGACAPGDLLKRSRFVAPDDGNAEDRTVLAVPLDRPVAPGESVDLDMAWVSHVPRTFARTGVIGTYYFFGQWFPKIGVWQDQGWNCHQFHATTEFFSDFGSYRVALTVPSGWKVGATGRAAGTAGTAAADGRRTFEFAEDDVHDFAWTTSPDFISLTQNVTAAAAAPVAITLLLQPEHLTQADRHFDAVRLALERYGAWFGAYPYDHLTVVDPVAIFNARAQGGSSGGMEYPTLITAGTRLVAPLQGLQPESVTIHEAGHQFWYGVVATNEFENAWMDEGINSYAQARVMSEGLPWRFKAVGRYFGGLAAWTYLDVPWSRELDGDRLNHFRPWAAAERQDRPSWQYWPPAASAITYDKTALWMHTLERYIGWPAMQQILSTYFSRGAFQHPTPDDFFAVVNEVTGRDFTWFFDQVYRRAAVFDYAVAQVVSEPRAPRGMVGTASSTFSEGSGSEGFDHTILVRRLGDGVFPVPVKVTFEDGASVVEQWDGRDEWHAFRYRRAAAVRSVEVDPDRVLLLDVNVTNNSWTARPRAADAARKWSLRWLTWVEELLVTYSLFS